MDDLEKRVGELADRLATEEYCGIPSEVSQLISERLMETAESTEAIFQKLEILLLKGPFHEDQVNSVFASIASERKQIYNLLARLSFELRDAKLLAPV